MAIHIPDIKKIPKLIHQKVRTRVPDDNRWANKRVLTARAAIVACSACRNQITRGLADLSDQFKGIDRIGEGLTEASMVIVRGPVVRPLGPTRIEVPSGLGNTMEMTIGVNTVILSEIDFGADVVTLSKLYPSDFLLKLSDQFRQKTSECCRQQVWDRCLPQSNQRRTIDVQHKRTRRKRVWIPKVGKDV